MQLQGQQGTTRPSAHEAGEAAILLGQEAQAQAHLPLPLHLCQQGVAVHDLRPPGALCQLALRQVMQSS